jgi:hypothetical protein
MAILLGSCSDAGCGESGESNSGCSIKQHVSIDTTLNIMIIENISIGNILIYSTNPLDECVLNP